MQSVVLASVVQRIPDRGIRLDDLLAEIGQTAEVGRVSPDEAVVELESTHPAVGQDQVLVTPRLGDQQTARLGVRPPPLGDELQDEDLARSETARDASQIFGRFLNNSVHISVLSLRYFHDSCHGRRP
jgi:hypothetical protein